MDTLTPFLSKASKGANIQALDSKVEGSRDENKKDITRLFLSNANDMI